MVTDARRYRSSISTRHHGRRSWLQEIRAARTRVRVGDVVRMTSSSSRRRARPCRSRDAAPQHDHRHQRHDSDAKQIAELPLGDGTAYMLTRLAPGIMDSSDLHFARPMDNGNLAGIVANGVQGGNEFTIDGAPNMSNARGVGFSPPSDAIAQFKVQTNAFDAQTRPHRRRRREPRAQERHERAALATAATSTATTSRSATPLLTERAGGTKPTREYNRFTGTVSGPIVQEPDVLHGVVRAPARRPAGAVDVHGADREDARRATSASSRPGLRSGHRDRRAARARRSPNNVIPAGRINPVAAAYAAMYPQPNRPGTVGNYFTQHAAALRLQRRHGPRRSQLQLGRTACS